MRPEKPGGRTMRRSAGPAQPARWAHSAAAAADQAACRRRNSAAAADPAPARRAAAPSAGPGRPRGTGARRAPARPAAPAGRARPAAANSARNSRSRPRSRPGPRPGAPSPPGRRRPACSATNIWAPPARPAPASTCSTSSTRSACGLIQTPGAGLPRPGPGQPGAQQVPRGPVGLRRPGQHEQPAAVPVAARRGEAVDPLGALGEQPLGRRGEPPAGAPADPLGRQPAVGRRPHERLPGRPSPRPRAGRARR